jgi:hypothetical protein
MDSLYLWNEQEQTTHGQSFVDYYVDYQKQVAGMNKENCLTRDDWKIIYKIYTALWHTVARHFIENEGGVFLKSLGYLCHLAEVEVSKFKFIVGCVGKQRDIEVNNRNGHNYHKLLLTDRMNKDYYVMVDTFQRPVNQEIFRRMGQGVNYRFLYSYTQAYANRKVGGNKKRLKYVSCHKKCGAPYLYYEEKPPRNPLWQYFTYAKKKSALLKYGKSNPDIGEEVIQQKVNEHVKNLRTRFALKRGKKPVGYEEVWQDDETFYDDNDN